MDCVCTISGRIREKPNTCVSEPWVKGPARGAPRASGTQWPPLRAAGLTRGHRRSIRSETPLPLCSLRPQHLPRGHLSRSGVKLLSLHPRRRGESLPSPTEGLGQHRAGLAPLLESRSRVLVPDIRGGDSGSACPASTERPGEPGLGCPAGRPPAGPGGKCCRAPRKGREKPRGPTL